MIEVIHPRQDDSIEADQEEEEGVSDDDDEEIMS